MVCRCQQYARLIFFSQVLGHYIAKLYIRLYQRLIFETLTHLLDAKSSFQQKVVSNLCLQSTYLPQDSPFPNFMQKNDLHTNSSNLSCYIKKKLGRVGQTKKDVIK